MTPAELKAIRARADAATAGPWKIDKRDCDEKVDWETGRVCIVVEGGETVVDYWAKWADDSGMSMKKADGEFIAAARTAVPALCDALEKEWAANRAMLYGRLLDVERYLKAEQALEAAQREIDQIARHYQEAGALWDAAEERAEKAEHRVVELERALKVRAATDGVMDRHAETFKKLADHDRGGGE